MLVHFGIVVVVCVAIRGVVVVVACFGDVGTLGITGVIIIAFEIMGLHAGRCDDLGILMLWLWLLSMGVIMGIFLMLLWIELIVTITIGMPKIASITLTCFAVIGTETERLQVMIILLKRLMRLRMRMAVLPEHLSVQKLASSTRVDPVAIAFIVLFSHRSNRTTESVPLSEAFL